MNRTKFLSAWIKNTCIVVLLYLLGSCSLEISEADQISGSEAIGSLVIAEDVLRQAYADFPADKMELTILSEDLVPSYLIAYDINLRRNYNWDSENIRNFSTNYWESYYKSLASINALLASESVLLAKTADRSKWSEIKGSALGLKGLIYFELLQLYSDRNESNPMGILPQYSVSVENNSRLSYSESITTIALLFKEARLLLEKVEDAKIAYMSLQAIALLEARLDLFAKNYDGAIDKAEKALFLNRLEISDYADLWHNKASSLIKGEVILVFDHQKPPFNYLDRSGTDGDFFYLPSSLIFEEADIRFEKSYFNFEMKHNGKESVSRKLLGKYRNKLIGNPAAPIVQLRYAEYYFIAAECYFKKQQDVEAIAVLNRLLQARNASPLPSSLHGQELYLRIQLEKQKEFIGESLNYLDLKRWNKNIRRFKVEDENSWDEIDSDNFRWTLPLPRQEILQNIQAIQNKGW
ncbi:RagB/SusD family nutrient uptake outer membrane protein [Flavobacterium sp. NKUCC04_CG]|uniref:RagB/SusD family nutrient uptake outer membrane protein n=1 Tax=Flavobacterium sp. NKUCC04_CG TaxID=2842121 RepID=UPI001C5BE02E|nr:RagB/SusD family nutrient uptake outer membrane protein [Flavobacterium sp. NKUCC04_CG]MBW3519814.1 RagB/SusD family nutrient uptake outer membrane protein [Flavobacterium sp. NKUCC04_CG]